MAQACGAAHVGVDDRHQVADVSHIGGTAPVVHVANILLADQVGGVGPENLRHGLVLLQGHVAGDGLNLHLSAHRHGPGPESPVNLHVGVHERL